MIRNFAIVAALMAAFMIGCGDKKEDSGSDAAGGSSSTASTGSTVTPVSYLCGKCGHDGGKDHVCDTKCESCTDCGLHKGSDLCCKVSEDDKGKDICSCGYAKGSENCCEEGAEKCDKCHMIKGSTYCCKIPHGEEGHDHDNEAKK